MRSRSSARPSPASSRGCRNSAACRSAIWSLTQPLNAIEAAIKQQDAQKFSAAYDQLGQGCNACHMELDHPYVVIKTPDASAFPNQDFKAQR
jgi:cytochrome c556